MAQNIMTTTTPSIAPEFQTYYDRTLLKRLRQRYIHDQWAQKRPMPKNRGKTIQFRRFGDLAPATTPLTESVTPPGNSASVSEITATVQSYGDYIMFSDMVSLTALDPELVRYAEVLGDQAAETLDVIVRDVLAGGTNVIYAGGKTARDQITPSDKLTSLEIRKARRFFQRNKVKPVDSEGNYVLIIHPDAEFDLYDDPKWEEAQKYGNKAGGLFTGEIGRLYGFRIVVTPNAKVFTGAGADGANVYAAIALGQEAYGVVDIEGSGNVKNIIKPLGSAGSEDPLDQRQTTGWKVQAFACVRLQELAVLRIEHGASS